MRGLCPVNLKIINIMEKTKEVLMSDKDIIMEGRFWVDSNGASHRYVDPMTDKGFKILFGSEENKELLIGLLNRIIPDADIVDLSYCNTEHQGMTEDDSGAIFDVYCENSEGVRFLVEMQNWSQRYFYKRAVYYSTFAIQDQAAKEKKHQLKTLGKTRWDYNYAPVFMVCFMSFNMREATAGMEKIKEDDYISFYRYSEMETGEQLGDGTTLVFVEMKKFRKDLIECKTEREEMLHTLKNMHKMPHIPVYITDPLLKEIYEKAEIAALPEHLRNHYINFIMSRNDELNSRAEMYEAALAKGREEGRELGREIGLAEGREVGLVEGREVGLVEGAEASRADIIRKMRSKGMNAEEIGSLLDIDISIIEAAIL